MGPLVQLSAQDNLSNIVTGVPQQDVTDKFGNWSVNTANLDSTNLQDVAISVLTGQAIDPVDEPAHPAVSQSPKDLIADAVEMSNAVANINNAKYKLNAAAATGAPVSNSVSTIKTQLTTDPTVSNILTDLNVIGQIAEDIAAMEKKGTAKLHWWGWEATLDEDGTKALEKLMDTDIKTAAAIAGALAAISPIAAAVFGIIALVAGTIGTDVSNTDKGNGVVIKGWLWVGIAVTAV